MRKLRVCQLLKTLSALQITAVKNQLVFADDSEEKLCKLVSEFGIVVVVVVGQTVGSISSRTLAFDCLCTLELCTASMIATS